MSLFRHVRKLLDVTDPTTTNVVGRTWLIVPGFTDPAPDHAMAFRASAHGGHAVPAPVVDPCSHEPPEPVEPGAANEVAAAVVIETSVDKTNWVAVSLSAPIDGNAHMGNIRMLGPYVRARVHSARLPYQLAVYLLGNAAYRLEPV
jgi:hypothetical protein